MALSSTSSTRTRASNLTGLIDIDALVEAQTLRQKNKINTQTQDLKIQQYKQLMYQEIQSKAHSMYQKYCDLTNSFGLYGLDTSGYKGVKFSSSNSNAVTATADSTAKAVNYKVNVEQMAETAKYQLNKNELTEGKVISIKQGDKSYNFTLSGTTEKDRASNLNKQLQEQGFDLKASYSDFINNGGGGLLVETSKTGKDAKFSVGSEASGTVITHDALSGQVNSTGMLNLSSLSEGSVVSINGTSFTLRGSTNDDRIENLKHDLEADSTLSSKVEIQMGPVVDNSGNIVNDADHNPIVGMKLVAKAYGELEQVSFTMDGTTYNGTGGALPEYAYSDSFDLSSYNGKTLRIGNYELKIPSSPNMADLNNQLEHAGIKVKLTNDEHDSSKVKFQATERGIDYNFKVSSYSSSISQDEKKGEDSKYTITDLSSNNSVTGTSSSNEVKLDGVTFSFTGVTGAGDSNAITLTGKKDTSDLTDKIVDFLNDYNELLGNINTKLYEQYDKSYRPLTDDDKTGLTDSQITEFEKKSKIGLLQNDDTLTEFANAMKEVMTTISSGGQSIERLGFTAVNDYKAENGLFNIPSDTTKVAENIANNIDDVKELFSGQNGVLKKLGDVFKKYSSGSSGVTPQSSILGSLAGITNGSYNDITTMGKDIVDRKKTLAELQASLVEKENNLYSKYSSLESNLSKLQSQQSSLSSYFS